MADKMFVTKTPAGPSQCVVCYTKAKGILDFIDFGASLDYYGAILICELCLVNAAKLVGYVSEDTSNKAVADAVASQAEVISLRLKVQTLESLVASYVTDPDFSLDALFSNVSDLPLEFELSPTDEDSAGASDDSNDAAASDESGLTKSTTV